MPEIRCDHRLHAVVSDNSIGILIVRCHNKLCKPQDTSVITEHHFNLEKINEDGIIYPIDTKWYKQPK